MAQEIFSWYRWVDLNHRPPAARAEPALYQTELQPVKLGVGDGFEPPASSPICKPALYLAELPLPKHLIGDHHVPYHQDGRQVANPQLVLSKPWDGFEPSASGRQSENFSDWQTGALPLSYQWQKTVWLWPPSFGPT